MNDDHIVRMFTRLMLHGRVREAVCFATNQSGGGMLKPDDIDTKSGKCVLDVLKEKHPPPGVAVKSQIWKLPCSFCQLEWYLQPC